MRFHQHRSLPILLALILLITACVPATDPATLPGSTPTATSLPATRTSTPHPTRTATPEPTASPSPVPASPTPVVDVYRYIQTCETLDALVNTYDRQYGLEQLRFSTQLSQEAQARLALPVLVEPSCNVKTGNTPIAVVIHATRGGLTASISQFQQKNSSSIHYIIDRDGQVYQMVPEELIAFHVTCCTAQFGEVREDYRQSIGIELVNKLYVNPKAFDRPIFEDFMESFGYRYWEDYPAAQIASLVVLIEDIVSRWGISMDQVGRML